ncbi:MAG: DUF1992 domain-containing protein [Anaerolineae bacterium]|nr:DUF1992 domain-containing protein [Anaerolineae bacterium]MDW8101997.1 DUF1992 domain-containing protein [Anaerolineae bacterium]
MDWGEIVEEKIKEAIARGEFDNLPGKGQPLALEDYPFTPPEWRLAFKILASAGFVPDWIALDNEIRERIENWQKAASSLRGTDEGKRCWLKEEVEEINKLIELFNLKVPIVWLQRRKFCPKIP